MKDKIKKYFKLLRDFGIKIMLYQFICSTIFKNNTKLGKYFDKKKHENVKRYLLANYEEVLNSYKDIEVNADNIKDNKIIWILWWQGINDAPDIVQMAINSVKENNNEYDVVIIDLNNYNDYICIPDNIITKLNNNEMTITHFSDILRMALLAEHGGVWIDATVLCTKTLDDLNIDNYKFYTIKHGLYHNWHVCKGLWSGFFIASGKNNPVFCFFRDMFYEYWKNENSLICYFLIDCIIAIGYENISYIKEQIDMVPQNNSEVFMLQSILNKKFEISLWKNLIIKCNMHKLNYKMQLDTFCDGEKITFYGYLMDEYRKRYNINT